VPTYDYICENCGDRFERFQSITAKMLLKCPKCGKRKLKRLIGLGSGIIFKGNGFYQTDYRSDEYKKARKNEKSTETAASEKKTKAKAERRNCADKTKTETKDEMKSA